MRGKGISYSTPITFAVGQFSLRTPIMRSMFIEQRPTRRNAVSHTPHRSRIGTVLKVSTLPRRKRSPCSVSDGSPRLFAVVVTIGSCSEDRSSRHPVTRTGMKECPSHLCPSNFFFCRSPLYVYHNQLHLEVADPMHSCASPTHSRVYFPFFLR